MYFSTNLTLGIRTKDLHSIVRSRIPVVVPIECPRPKTMPPLAPQTESPKTATEPTTSSPADMYLPYSSTAELENTRHNVAYVFQSTAFHVLFRSHPSGRNQMSNEPTPHVRHTGTTPRCYGVQTPVLASSGNFETVEHSGRISRVFRFDCARYRKWRKTTRNALSLSSEKFRRFERCENAETHNGRRRANFWLDQSRGPRPVTFGWWTNPQNTEIEIPKQRGFR